MGDRERVGRAGTAHELCHSLAPRSGPSYTCPEWTVDVASQERHDLGDLEGLSV